MYESNRRTGTHTHTHKKKQNANTLHCNGLSNFMSLIDDSTHFRLPQPINLFIYQTLLFRCREKSTRNNEHNQHLGGTDEKKTYDKWNIVGIQHASVQMRSAHLYESIHVSAGNFFQMYKNTSHKLFKHIFLFSFFFFSSVFVVVVVDRNELNTSWFGIFPFLYVCIPQISNRFFVFVWTVSITLFFG